MKLKAEIVNLRGVERDFDRMLLGIKQVASDTINGQLLFTVETANQKTQKSSPQKINADMNTYLGRFTRAEALVRKQRKAQGLAFLAMPALRKEAKKFIKRKIATITYLKSGWFAAIYQGGIACKKSKYYTVIKKFDLPWDKKTKLLGTALKGGILISKTLRSIMLASAWNGAGEGKKAATAKVVLQDGLSKAIIKTNRQLKRFAEEMVNAWIKNPY